MTNSTFMKLWAPLVFPTALFVFLALLFITYPAASTWPQHASFLYMPYVLTGIGFLLGGFFTQSRVSFICLLLAVITFLLNHSFFVTPDPAKGETVIFLSAMYVPPLMVLFYHLSERGIFTIHGFIRILIIFSATLVIILLPEIQSLSDAVSSAGFVVFRPTSAWLRIPVIGIAVLVPCVLFLFIRNQHESPLLGPMFCVALLFVFGGLNFQSSAWRPGQAQAVLLFFMSGAAVTLACAVMENLWWHAHIDELTQLPSRRSLKHHFGRLGPTYAIAVLDVDHFKKINDRYGHDTGDQVLRFVASCLHKNRIGRAYRYGGEEFVIVCEGNEFDEAASALEELRKAISKRKFNMRRHKERRHETPEPGACSPSRLTFVTRRAADRPARPPSSRAGRRQTESITVTVSIGVARNTHRYSSPEEVLKAADKALYQAKKDGRNRTKVTR